MTTSQGVTYRAASDLNDDVLEQAIAFLNRHAREVIEGDVDLSLLTGGASNVNVKVVTSTRSFALRLCDPDAPRWRVDRAAAIQAQRDAASVGLAPQVLACELPSGHYLAEFAPGAQLTTESLRDEATLRMVATTWRRLNASPTTSRVFSPFDDAKTWIELADADEVARPDRLDEMLAALVRVEALFLNRAAPRGFCHSDSVPQNYLEDDGAIQLVDFDYAGEGWTAFELGSLCCQAELDDWQTETLLRAYDPQAGDGERARVELMRFVAGIREASWALMAEPYLSHKTATLDGWTYQGHAERNLRQASQVIDSGAFDTYIKAARMVREGARC